MKRKAIYALSADPITNGHLNIIDRMLQNFDYVLVGIGVNKDKTYLFELDEREKLTKLVLSKYGKRVEVKSFSGLLTDFAYENQIFTIVRGARNSADFDFEKMLADINQGLRLNLDTYILIADPNLSHISSSTVKELQKHQANNISEYVPLVVKQALELKVSWQYLIGVTGGIGCGKSYVTRKLVEKAKQMDDEYFHSIDMDELGRYILTISTEPLHIGIRKKVAESLGKELLVKGKINTKLLLKYLFDEKDSPAARVIFEQIMQEPMTHLFRRELKDLRGIILINSALFVESNICGLVNNNILFVECKEDKRIQRLTRSRGYSVKQARDRISAQISSEEKIARIQKEIEDHSCGELIIYDNNIGPEMSIIDLYTKIVEKYHKEWKV